ncbi:MAG: hypothetical protein ACOC7R_01285 [Planctomycetota bacterium]
MRDGSPIRDLDVRIVGEMTQVRPTGPVAAERLLYGPGVEAVRVAAAANETVSFQVVVDAGATPLEDVRVHVSDLAATQGRVVEAGRIDLFVQVPVVAEVPPWVVRLGRDAGDGEAYDMLVPVEAPVGGEPFDVPAGGRLALWVDVPVARETTAGRYAGELTVSVRAGVQRIERNIPLKVDVWDLILPDTRPVTALGTFDHRTLFAALLDRRGEPFRPVWMDRSDPLVRRGLAIMRQLMVLAHRHHLDLFDTAIRPVFKRDQTGAIRLHWDDYDAVVTPYLSGSAFDDRIGVAAWPAPWFDGWPDPTHYGGIDTHVYRRTAEGLIERTVEHFERIGHADTLLFYPIRTPPAARDDARLVAMADPVRRLAPEVPILSRLPLHPPAGEGLPPPENVAAFVDLTAPAGQWLDPARAGDGAYLAPGDPPYVPPMDVFASPADLRALGWLAMRADLAGLFLPDVLGWDAEAGDGAGLFYPGTAAGLEAVLPSVRLKRLRRGLEDAAWIRLLRRRGGAEAAERIVPMMARYLGLQAAGDHRLDGRRHGWVADGPSWRLARVLLAAEVAAAGVGEDAADDETALARRLARGRLAEAAGRLIAERIATRVEAADDPVAEGRLTVTVAVDLFNPTTEAVQATLRLPEPPEEFTLVISEAAVTLTAGGRTTATVRFTCPLRPATPAGKLTVPLRVEVPDQPTRMLTTAVSLLVSRPAGTDVTVDGDLAEWPARPGNVAGEFARFGRRGSGGAEVADLATRAWVQHDKDCIYLGFRCELADDAAATAEATNRLRHDQWMPVGEDVVEIILDPGAGAISADELYRLTIKANGVCLPARGLPGEGERFWPVDPQVAVRQADDVIYVEAALPRPAFAAFGDARHWRVNLVRIAANPPEASNWAEAARQPYHPDTMGNLFLLEE